MSDFLKSSKFPSSELMGRRTSKKLSFDDAFRYILDVEGGYSNDAGDPGGPTKYGINRYDAPYLRELGVPDIQSLTPAHAKEIYRAKYWNQGWAGLPAPSSLSNPRLAAVMFDTAVNPRQSVVKTVQRIFGNPNLNDDEKADEIIRARTQNYQGAKPQFVKGLTNRMAKLSSFVGLASQPDGEEDLMDSPQKSEPDYTPNPRPRARPAVQPQAWRARTADDRRNIGYGSQDMGVDVRRVQAEIDRLRAAKKKKISEIEQKLIRAQDNHVIANVRTERQELSNIDSAIKASLNKLNPRRSTVPTGPPVYVKPLPKGTQGPLQVVKPYEYENNTGAFDFLHLNDFGKKQSVTPPEAKPKILDFTKLAQPPAPPQRPLSDYEKRARAQSEYNNRKIKGYETATGPVEILVKLPVSGVVVPATFSKAPTNGQMRNWIRQRDRTISTQLGIAHPEIIDKFDKLDVDAVEVANAVRYGSKAVKTKGGDGQVSLKWAAERVAKILGIKNVQNLMQRGTPEYKFLNLFVKQLGYTPDSDDVNFREAGIDAGTAGIIKRNPGIAYDNGWDTYMRGLRSAMSPSDMVSIMGGDTRSQEEIDSSKINVYGFDVNEGLYRGAADMAVNIGASILTGGVAGIAKSGVEGMSKGMLKSVLLAGGKQASGKAAFKTLVSSAASMAEKKAASAVLLQNGLRSLTTNVAQNTPGVFTGARDIQATTGKSYWDSLKQSAGDAAVSQFNQMNPATIFDSSKSDAERFGAFMNAGGQLAHHGMKLFSKKQGTPNQGRIVPNVESSLALESTLRFTKAMQEAGFNDHHIAALSPFIHQTLEFAHSQKHDLATAVSALADHVDPSGKLKQIEGLILAKELPQHDNLNEIVKYMDSYTRQHPTFNKDLSKLTSQEIEDIIVDHTHRELDALDEVAPQKAFFGDDIEQKVNPELREWGQKHLGRELTEGEVKLYHLVSALASPANNPSNDSRLGFAVFTKYLDSISEDGSTAGGFTLSARGEKPSTIWAKDDSGKKVDTGIARKDKSGNIVMSRISRTYLEQALNRVSRLISETGSLDNAMQWLGEHHSFEELERIAGKRLKQHEYLTKEGGGLGAFGLGDVPKIGSYILNRWGEYGTITKDMWVARQMARMLGTGLIVNGKVVTRPWNLSKEGIQLRKALDDAWTRVAAERGSTPAEIQSDMWALEQYVYNKLGAPREPKYASQGLAAGIQDFENKKAAKLNQSDHEHGFIQGTYNPQTKVIELVKGKADVSTVIHELGHYLHQSILDHPEHGQTIRRHYGDLSNVEGAERFARHVENYMRTGVAPVKSLQSVYEAVARWMHSVTARIKYGTPPAEVRKILNGVYGRVSPETASLIRQFEKNWNTTT